MKKAYNSREQYDHLSTTRTLSFVSSLHIEIHHFENKIWSKEMQRLNNLFCHLLFWSNEFSGGKLRSVFSCQDHFGWEMTDIFLCWQALIWQVIFTPSLDRVWTRWCFMWNMQMYSLARKKKSAVPGAKKSFSPLLCHPMTTQIILSSNKRQNVSQLCHFLNMKLPIHMHGHGHTCHSVYCTMSPMTFFFYSIR